jgi:superoxide dismutase, Cu-Zn family
MKFLRHFFWFLLMGIIPVQSACAESARAVIKDAKGVTIGSAKFVQEDADVRVTVEAKGLTPGLHGMHIHDLGVCTPPDFSSAGPHYNLHGKRHGLKNPSGAHTGDMPNLEAKADGTAKAVFTLKGVTLTQGVSSLFHEGGTSIVIHAAPDDELTDPSGNSGDRIACGVIEK